MKKLFIIAIALLLAFAAGRGLSSVLAQEPTPTPEGKPYLGVTLADLNPTLAKRLGLTQETGVVILKVAPDSPAAQAGLVEKDIILKVAGVAVATVKEVKAELEKYKPGDKITITVLRGTETKDISVTLGQAPSPKLEVFGKHLKGMLAPRLLPGFLGQAFDRFLGSELRYLDEEGNRITQKAVPGVVSAVGANTLTIVPNGETQAVTYTIGDAPVFKAGRKVQLSDLKEGDQVVIYLENDQVKRVMASVMVPFFGPGPRWGPGHFQGRMGPRMFQGNSFQGRGQSTLSNPILN